MNIDKVRKVIGAAVSRHAVQYVLIAFFVFASFAGLCLLNFLPAPLMNLAVGQVSPRDIEAPRTIEYVNQQATDEARHDAMQNVSPVYTADASVATRAVDELHRTFGILQEMSSPQALKNPAMRDELAQQAPLSLSGDAAGLKSLDRPTLEQLETISKTAVRRVLEKGVKDAELPAARQDLERELARVALPPLELSSITALTEQALKPNTVNDWDETFRRQQERSAEVPAVKVVIQRGTMIVRHGEVVKQEQAEILRAFGNPQVQLNIPTAAGVVLFTLIAMAVMLFYLAQHQPELLPRVRHMWLATLLLVSTAFLCHWLEQTNGYLSPVALCAMLTAILIDYRLAFVGTIVLSSLVGLFTGEYQYAVTALVTGTVAALSVAHVNRRNDLIYASLVVCLTNILTVLSMDLIIIKGIDFTQMGIDISYGLLNGVIASLTMMGALPFLENLFDVTTHIKLLELANPGEPLLQKLMVEAPGTYHHSIIVANLADAAARAIGADALLARVGAYYHDIGKMKRSTFFVENQIGVENPHDRLTPSLSTMIIHSHVSEGIEMAKQYRLPQPIRDFIDMHHGTRLVAYFFHQARETVGSDIPEASFRYHGRKPHSKETAIVMVADSIEAKARLLRQLDKESVQTMVNETLKTIMADGQLDDSDLSLRDVRQISEAFTTTLLGIYHNRVEYPKDVLKTLEETADRNSAAGAAVPTGS